MVLGKYLGEPTILVVEDEVKDGLSEDSDQEAPSKRQRTEDSELAARAAWLKRHWLKAACEAVFRHLDGADEEE